MSISALINKTAPIPMSGFDLFSIHQPLSKKSEMPNIRNIPFCSRMLEETTQIFFNCMEAKKLWEKVEKAGPFSLECATDQEAPTGAMAYLRSRRILISEQSNQTSGGHLLFELHNLDRMHKALAIMNQQCSLPVDVYAESIEAVEYETVKNTHEIAAQCVGENLWPLQWHVYKDAFASQENSWANFKEYLAVQEEVGHTDLYRQDWYQRCNPRKLSSWLANNKKIKSDCQPPT